MRSIEDDLIVALEAMVARFGSPLTRGEEQPKTFACHHNVQNTCRNCDGIVTAWMAINNAKLALARAKAK